MVSLSHIDRSRKAKQLTLDIQNKTLIGVNSATTKNLTYLSGHGNKYIAVGEDGTILKYNPQSDSFDLHSQSGIITTDNLVFIDISLGDGIAVGYKFTVLDYTQSTDTFTPNAINGYDTDVNLYMVTFPYTAFGVFYDIYVGEDTATGNGVIYNYDGGATPSKVFETEKGRITSLATLDWINYVAVGHGGGIYKSSDFGHTWTEVDTGVVDNFNDISGVTSSEFWLVTVDGKIYKFNAETDELTLVTDFDILLTRVWMLDVNDGYAVGSNGALIHYDGEIWSAIPTGTMIAFNGIYGLEHNKFYLVCSGGYIFRFYNMAYPSVNIDATGDVLDYRRMAKNTIVNALEIRDTNAHDIDTDTEIMSANMSLYSHCTIKVINTLDKDISVQVMGNFDDSTTNAETVGSAFTVASGDSESRSINVDNAGWQPYLYLKITASGVPTSGNVTAYIVKKPME